MESQSLGKIVLPLHNSLNLKPDTLILMKIANFIPYKVHQDLLKAFAMLQKRHSNQPMALCCLGHDRESYLKQLKQECNNLGIAEHVYWLENLSKLKSFWHQADIAIHCSHQEGLPNAVLEAMACKKAIVATDVGDIPELITLESLSRLISGIAERGTT